MSPAGRLYRCEVMHRRLEPVRYRFTYRVLTLLVDIDRLGALAARHRLFSHNRFNLLSFYDRDHGPRDGGALRPWLERELAGFGITLGGGTVQLLAIPRVLGYVFNPLSIWYCWHADGTLRAVLCEVKNTFGEQHGYLLHRHGEPMPWPVRAVRAKQLHVSPLIGMDARYHFRLSRPGDELQIMIREHVEARLMLVAAQRGRVQALSDSALLGAVARLPLMTFKVIAMIHWQALKIWLRGAPFHRKPSPPRREVSG